MRHQFFEDLGVRGLSDDELEDMLAESVELRAAMDTWTTTLASPIYKDTVAQETCTARSAGACNG